MWEIPLVLRTTPVSGSTLINDDDARITYSGSWRSIGHRGFSDYNDDVHYTTSVNDSLQFTFAGAASITLPKNIPSLAMSMCTWTGR
jgi:hypothetical protein